MTQAERRVNGRLLWSNLSLLFWTERILVRHPLGRRARRDERPDLASGLLLPE